MRKVEGSGTCESTLPAASRRTVTSGTMLKVSRSFSQALLISASVAPRLILDMMRSTCGWVMSDGIWCVDEWG